MYYSFIGVPGYRTPPVPDWDIRQELKRAALPVGDVSKLHMYTYQPSFDYSKSFSWERFLKTGNNLAEDLAQLASEVSLSPNERRCHPAIDAQLTRDLLVPLQANYLHCSFSWRDAPKESA